MRFLSLDYADTPYRHAFGDYNISDFTVYTEQGDLIGKVIDVLIDEMEHSYYLAVERHSFSHERFILPLIASRLSTSERRVYTTSLSKEQINNLPKYHKENTTRYSETYANTHSHEAHSNATAPNVADRNQTSVTAASQAEPLPVEASLPLEYSRPLESDIVFVTTETQRSVMHPTPVPEPPTLAETHSPIEPVVSTAPVEPVENDAAVVIPVAPVERQIVETYNVPLLAERLVVDRQRRKVGEVVVRKVIETQMVSVPVHREKLIVEQISPEHKSLAAIELGKGELSQVELRKLMPGLSDEVLQTVSDHAAIPTALQTETVPIQTALQILHQVSQASQFKQAAVKLVFDDEELQNRYQRWLAEHKN